MSCIKARLCSADSAVVNSHPVDAGAGLTPMGLDLANRPESLPIG
ncbi:MAG: hypothetical protein ACYCYK_04045 [Candidatus Dormibacteria bacterium]